MSNRKHKQRLTKRLRIVAAFNTVRAAIRKAAQSFGGMDAAMLKAAGHAIESFRDAVQSHFAEFMAARQQPKRLGPPSRAWWLRA
jgi:hypothetical protein